MTDIFIGRVDYIEARIQQAWRFYGCCSHNINNDYSS